MTYCLGTHKLLYQSRAHPHSHTTLARCPLWPQQWHKLSPAHLLKVRAAICPNSSHWTLWGLMQRAVGQLRDIIQNLYEASVAISAADPNVPVSTDLVISQMYVYGLLWGVCSVWLTHSFVGQRNKMLSQYQELNLAKDNLDAAIPREIVMWLTTSGAFFPPSQDVYGLTDTRDILLGMLRMAGTQTFIHESLSRLFKSKTSSWMGRWEHFRSARIYISEWFTLCLPIATELPRCACRAD